MLLPSSMLSEPLCSVPLFSLALRSRESAECLGRGLRCWVEEFLESSCQRGGKENKHMGVRRFRCATTMHYKDIYSLKYHVGRGLWAKRGRQFFPLRRWGFQGPVLCPQREAQGGGVLQLPETIIATRPHGDAADKHNGWRFGNK